MRIALTLAAALALTTLAAHAQEGFGPIDPTAPSGIMVPDLIKRMGERESAFEKARQDYEFRQTVKMNTIADDTNRPDGEYMQVTDITFDPKDGHRVEKVVFAPQNTIERVILTENDMKDVAERLPFILTTEQLPDYNLTYVGRQKVDDLDTYVFDSAPKQIVKGHRYFQGRIWVDQQDFEIVLVNGLNVPQETRAGKEDLSPPFTTYYQQIDGKYWFPTYTKAEGVLHFAAANGSLSQAVHLRNTVKYTDYKKSNFRTKVRVFYGNEEIQQAPPKKDEPKK
ncbi:hypothetical protein ACFQBQ_15675 [Granulicella cerasi]|uniref:Outer membrane lipoprotein-sorting protein n=1 Tax=Granulicella cerasi TaxID=741063 RepID=A0ABW1ZD17_9BACT|nr:hypothetical protein [Granulicella cerasi]